MSKVAVTVADRYPQDVFCEHTHEFCELVMVWRGNGLHVLNESAHTELPAAICFTFVLKYRYIPIPANDLVLQNIIYRPERLKTQYKLAGDDSRLSGRAVAFSLAAGQYGNESARQVINQLLNMSNGRDPPATRWRNCCLVNW